MESVWDYPRPPAVKPSEARVKVELSGIVLADTCRALRVLETSHPPTWYLPMADVRMDLLVPNRRRSICEFKGQARYWDAVVQGRRRASVAWSYPEPWPGYEVLAEHLCFYPSRVDACFVDGEQVQAQAGDFYGGWITSNVTGPFKGGPGTLGW